MDVNIKRAYEPADTSDGYRILVDRLWPRGVSKERAKIDLWLKEVAPSTELRKWFGHDPAKWNEFQKRYRTELKTKGDLLNEIIVAGHSGPVTLIYGARDKVHNEAAVLQQYLLKM